VDNKKIKSIIIAFVFVVIFALTFTIVFMSGDKNEELPKDTETTKGEDNKKEPEKDVKPYDFDLSEYITLGPFPGVDYDSNEITDFVEKSVDNMAMEFAEFTEVDKTVVQDGDTVVIDYVGTMDGKEFSGGTAKSQELTIGSKTYIDGFEAGLIGHSKGETVVLKLKFPDPYQSAPELAGKDVEFKVTINKIGVKNVPELTDDMVKSLKSDLFTTVDGYKEYMKEYYTAYLAWNKYFESCEVKKYPENTVNDRLNEMLENYETMASYYQTTLEKLVQASGFESLEKFKEELVKKLQLNIAHEMAVYQTIRANNIVISDEEYTQIAKEYATKEGYNTIEALKNAIGKNAVEVEVYRQKLISLIVAAKN